MKIEIQYREIIRVINFLDGLNLVGMPSIHRTNISIILTNKLKQISKNEEQLREELKGNDKALKEELEKFLDQKFVIDGGDNLVALKAVKKVIKDTIEKEEVSFSKADSYAVACLYNAFNLGGE